MNNHKVKLYQNLILHFNLNELEDLCFRLDVPYEEVSGTTLDGKARQLVGYMDRRSQLDKLVNIATQLREGILWSNSGTENDVSIPKWESMKIDWVDGSEMILLPVYSSSSHAYFMSKHPVTNIQYQSFVSDAVYSPPRGERFSQEHRVWTDGFEPWSDPNFSDGNMPVVCVSYSDAKHYCDWVNEMCRDSTEQIFRRAKVLLPTIRLWEFAAFGTSFPTLQPEAWLNQASRIHHKATLPVPIDTTGVRTNSREISDLFGNVWEWCAVHEDINQSESPSYIHSITSVITSPFLSREDILKKLVAQVSESITNSHLEAKSSFKGRIKTELEIELRGGSYLDDLSLVRPFETASRLDNKENTRHADLGFRICAKVPLLVLPSDLAVRLSECAVETW